MTGLASIFASHARSAREATCQYCGIEYTLGVNGIVDGCDDCTGTERASNGYALKKQSTPVCFCLEVQGDNARCPEHGKRKI